MTSNLHSPDATSQEGEKEEWRRRLETCGAGGRGVHGLSWSGLQS